MIVRWCLVVCYVTYHTKSFSTWPTGSPSGYGVCESIKCSIEGAVIDDSHIEILPPPQSRSHKGRYNLHAPGLANCIRYGTKSFSTWPTGSPSGYGVCESIKCSIDILPAELPAKDLLHLRFGSGIVTGREHAVVPVSQGAGVHHQGGGECVQGLHNPAFLQSSLDSFSQRVIIYYGERRGHAVGKIQGIGQFDDDIPCQRRRPELLKDILDHPARQGLEDYYAEPKF
jgi:hypothetical protein